MSRNADRTSCSEKGLPTPDSGMFGYIDFQPRVLFGVARLDGESIMGNVVALSKAGGFSMFPVCIPQLKPKIQRNHAVAARGRLPKTIEARTSFHEIPQNDDYPSNAVSGLQVRAWENPRPHPFICTVS